MSYRDLRNFTEMMRALGYHRLISIDNFRNPNFQLVAEVLKWLVKRYDANAELHPDVDTEQDRVIFIKSATEFMATKAHIKMNTKRLYEADGYAVKELLKVTSVLYETTKLDVSRDLDRGENISDVSFDVSSRINELKDARRLASEITAKGAQLYDMLSNEVDLRELRTEVVARPLALNEIESSLKASVQAVTQGIQKTLNMLDNVASDEATLDAKIEKKKTELERNNKRLQTLQSVRPAYMDDFERLEDDLKKLYDTYMVRFRNLAYLEHQLEEYHRVERDRLKETEEALKVMAEKLSQEEHRQHKITDNNDDDGDDQDGHNMFGPGLDDDDDDDGVDGYVTDKQSRPRHHRERPAHPEMGKQVIGGMNPDISGESESVESDDSEVDLDDVDYDGSEVNGLTNGTHLTRTGHQPLRADDDDDDDDSDF